MGQCHSYDVRDRFFRAQFIHSLLVHSFCFLHLTLSRSNIRLSRHHLGVNLSDIAPCKFECCFLLPTVQFEDRRSLPDLATK